MFCRQWRLQDPEKKIYLFSRVAKDEALDDLSPARFLIDQDLVTDPPKPEAFRNCIVIFDDIDTIPDKKHADCVRKIRDDLLETGRHEDVTVISTSHQIANYKNTRTLLNEASSVTIFPQSGSKYHIERYLKTYGGMDRATVQKILKLPSRWVTHYRWAPQFILHEHGSFLI
jgi:hypothetical protein